MSDNGKTPAVQVVALNPENGPFVEALHSVACAIREAGVTTADALNDLARVVAINATERVGQGVQDKAAEFVEALGRGVLGAAQRLKEA